jgi:heme exporter protein D
VSGTGNSKPTASFETNPLLPDNITNYIVDGNVPTGVADWKRAYKNYTISFDASESYDPDGNITQYLWDFDDGNITTVNATAMDPPIITHTYNITGTFTVTLVVMDNGQPSGNPEPLSSAPAKQTILVGLVLPFYNWTPFIYTVVALFAVAIAAFAAREILRSVRRRKEIKTKRALSEQPSAWPSAGAKSE